MNHGGAWCLLNKMETRGYLVKHLMIRIGSPGRSFEFLSSCPLYSFLLFLLLCSFALLLFSFAPRFPDKPLLLLIVTIFSVSFL